MCLSLILSFPGEVKIFFRNPGEIKLDDDDSDVFSYWWDYDVSVKGFEYVGITSPTNGMLNKPENWKRTTEKSRIMRVG